MENLNITMECLHDLVAFHTERIKGYETLLTALPPESQHLTTLFDAFIKQSVDMKAELLGAAGAVWGAGEKQAQQQGKFGLAWSVVKAVFSSRMPTYPLEKCKSGENALLIAYHSIEGTEGLHPSVRTLVNRQKREVIDARDWIVPFERRGTPPSHRQLATVS
ncbi:hypothetical protein SAMN05421747_101513 [Parapedobacter composti]|uniref:DUF2383 domain-containing protein n=1 Tax=Parapedobacter composti TaxID=623281 RepID=A0A1I1EJK1_9SPHI|nr:hypothetical protein [Parapedobacter composti]SFB85160.1 hypothetical protein SAMN05421747_101513 [Parapedobacter composti]